MKIIHFVAPYQKIAQLVQKWVFYIELSKNGHFLNRQKPQLKAEMLALQKFLEVEVKEADLDNNDAQG